jgi:phosphoglycolate phosphatase-like HAD superfamily hydrolase
LRISIGRRSASWRRIWAGRKRRARTRVEDVIYSRWEQVLRRVPLYPGVPELLAALRGAGLRLGAMSDFPVASKLELLGLSGVLGRGVFL